MTFPFRRRSVNRKEYRYQGQKFASKAERDFAEWMDHWKITWMYEPESFKYVLPDRKYTPDFRVARNDGSYFYVEFKGWLRPEDRTKMKAFKLSHPDIDVRFVFLKANKLITKNSKTTYSAWAEQHGFKWAENEIPDEWLEEGCE
jgi:predicted nuclease of restriction endonuclease-like RecB superfamily